ncbi:diguanylate cyclase [Acidovorax sp. GBBC 3334]|uniref:sensor domain-containing diguanylate cyclase n=1 Tax=Acidovorax sp. GBBC 3334 TaxID=2940496 RepID=UPI0023035745|nr:diguanylate cyclase [Acidovorax sp. GBBC 3334]MDA8456929.1 diguanylate cyclase [Acidovorax sp. GBBC 3334]
MLDLERFFLWDGAEGAAPSSLLVGSHDPVLVALSVGVAVLSSTLALYLSGQARNAQVALSRTLALTSAGVALGAGIWAMHFIGMLSFALCAPVHYDVGTTLLSMLPAMGASWLALSLLARDRVATRQLLLGGVLVGAGIGTMHYMGMAAMRMAPLLRYDPVWFLASLAVAVGLANAALWVRFMLQRRIGMAAWQANLLGGAIMGSAIAGMHYTAMAAARFVGTAEPEAADAHEWAQMLALTVALVTACVGLFAGAVNGLILYRDLYRKVRRSESRLRALVDTAVDGIITIDSKGIVQSFNQSAERIFGWSAADVQGRNIRMLMPSPYAQAHDGYLERYLATGEARIIGTGREVVGLHRDGSGIPLRLSIGRADAPGGPLFVGFLIDLRGVKEAEMRLGIAASVFEHSYEAVLILDSDHHVVDANPAFERMTGLCREDLLGHPLEELYPAAAGADDADPDAPAPARPRFPAIWRAVQSQGYWQGEMLGRGLESAMPQRVSIAGVLGKEGHPHHYIVVITDISQLKAHELELEHIALYDSLTGLPNRRLLADRLVHAIAQAQRRHQLLAVCYLDLDGFKRVNDQHGHAAGDQLLIEVGRRIQTQLRAEDTLARLGGDEMVVLINGLQTPADCDPLIERILLAVRQPVPLSHGQGFVSASIGLSFYPLDGDAPDLLLRQADHAMYEAKQDGKNQCRRFGAAAPVPPPARPAGGPTGPAPLEPGAPAE